MNRPPDAGPPLPMRLLRPVIRLLPRGRYRLAHAWVVRRNVLPFVATIETPCGPVRFVCDLRDVITREAYLIGMYEPQETLLVEALLRPGDVMVDVGANWGYFTLLAARAVGPTGQVHAYEPDPRMFEALGTNARLNAFSHVTTRGVAVARERGSAVLRGFMPARGNFGTSRLVNTPATPTDFTVPTVPLDEAFGHLSAGGVRLLKMDIEGGEAAALAGAARSVQHRVFAFVLIELHPGALGPAMAHVEDGLREAGYRGWAVDHTPAVARRAAGRRIPWRSVLRELGGVESWPHHLWAAPGVALPGDA